MTSPQVSHPYQMTNPSNSSHQTTLGPLIFISALSPPNHTLTSWLELLLEDKSITLNLKLGNQPLVVILHDSAYLAQVLKKSTQPLNRDDGDSSLAANSIATRHDINNPTNAITGSKLSHEPGLSEPFFISSECSKHENTSTLLHSVVSLGKLALHPNSMGRKPRRIRKPQS